MKSILFFLAVLAFQPAFAQPEQADVAPGKDRWEIKTSASVKKSKNVTLEKLLSLPLMDKEYSTKAYDNKLVPDAPASGMKEGDMITTKGYLHLVAFEHASGSKEDGDYHIQLTLNPEWGDSCFIVEVPYAGLIEKSLKDSAENVRRFIRDNLLKGKEPSTAGSIMTGTVYVSVTGQLFYDAIHAGAMRGNKPTFRGKKGMQSYTAWELHPITHIEFARKPKS